MQPTILGFISGRKQTRDDGCNQANWALQNEGSQNFAVSWGKNDHSVGPPLNYVYVALPRAISGFYLTIPPAMKVLLQEFK